jgi:hypothetical protein
VPGQEFIQVLSIKHDPPADPEARQLARSE